VHIVISTGPNLPVPALRGGAVNRFWSQMAPEFARRGHEVTVCARAFAGQATEELREGVRYVRSGGFDAGRFRFGNYVRSLTAALGSVATLPRGDVFITNDAFSPWLLAARGLARHTLVAVGRAPKGQFRWYPASLQLTVPTTATRRAVAAEAPKLARHCSVLPYAIDTSVFHPEKTAHAERAQRILYVGRMHPEKGVHILISAFAELHRVRPDMRLILLGPSAAQAGGGGAGYLGRLKTLATGLPVEWHDPTYSPARLAETYRSCAWFVYPSLAEAGETFGVGPLEAMACGCIPLLSNLDCFRDFLNPGINGQFFNHRADSTERELAECLDILLSADHELMAAAATRTASAYSISAVANRWLEKLEELREQSLT